MKANSPFRLLAVIAVFSLIVSSCSKEELNDSPILISDVQQVGTVTDLGPVSGDIRKMVVNLGNQGELIDQLSGEQTGYGIELNVSILTDEDHHLPSGTYSFPFVSGTFPFDIESGDAFVKFLDEEKGSDRFRVVSGTFTVSSDNNEYQINFDFELASGDSFTGSVKGALSYEDLHD